MLKKSSAALYSLTSAEPQDISAAMQIYQISPRITTGTGTLLIRCARPFPPSRFQTHRDRFLPDMRLWSVNQRTRQRIDQPKHFQHKYYYPNLTPLTVAA